MTGVNVIILTAVMSQWMERSIGAYQLSSFIRSNGYSTQVIDFIHFFNKEQLMEILKKITNDETMVISISSTFIWDGLIPGSNYNPINSMLMECLTEYKKMYPNIKLVVGGSKALTYQNVDIVDHIITGYGEIAFLNLLKNGCKNKVIDATEYLKDFNVECINHEFTDNDIILFNETLPIEISRGCIFRCKFCSYPLNGKKKLDYIRDIELIKNELVNNYEKWGITNYLISDDTFNDNNEKLKKIHDMVISLPFKINFVGYLRIDLLYHYRDTQLEMLENMGLKSCHFGIESFNPKTAKFIGKGFSGDKTKEFLLYLKERWKGKISFFCSFIAGLPFETKESCIETKKWCLENDILFWMLALVINPNNFHKSELDINYQKYGYVLDKHRWTNPLMTSADAEEAQSKIEEMVLQTISSWNMFAILSSGIYTFEELNSTVFTEFDHTRYQNQLSKRFDEYLTKLRELYDR